MVQPASAPFLLQSFDLLGHLRDALVGQEPGDWQRHQRPHLAVGDDTDGALLCLDGRYRRLHIGLVGSGNDDVVAVVPDAGGYRPALQAKILQQAIGDVAGRFAVALDHRNEAQAVARKQRRPVFCGLDRDLLMDQRDAGQRGLDRVDGTGLRRQLRRQLDLLGQLHGRICRPRIIDNAATAPDRASA
ncbi:hypothetical protein ACVWZZ_007392 [Bradyrhizobium sp. LM6.10]